MLAGSRYAAHGEWRKAAGVEPTKEASGAPLLGLKPSRTAGCVCLPQVRCADPLDHSVAWLAERAHGARQVSNGEVQWMKASTGTFPRNLAEFADGVAPVLT